MNKFKNVFDIEAWQRRLEAEIYDAESMLYNLLEEGKITYGTYFQLRMKCHEARRKLLDIGNKLYCSMINIEEKAEEL